MITICYKAGQVEIWRGSQQGRPLGFCPIYRGGERLDKEGEKIWPGIIELPLQCDVLKAAQLNWPFYDKKLVPPAPKDITTIPYVSGYFMKGSEFDIRPSSVFLCGKVH